jgi:tetratricopeptide (TPR) repeat protein
MLKFISYLFLLIIPASLFAQSEKEMYREAIELMNVKEYAKAYDIMDKLYSKKPKNEDYLFTLGVICLNYPERKERALEIFEALSQKKKDMLEMKYYLGKAYHLNYKFKEAIPLIQDFINNFASIKKPTEEQNAMLNDAFLLLNYSENGKSIMENKVFCKIENIGSPINTEASEYVPVISADETIMIFTYVGPKSTGGLINDDLQPDKDEGYYHEDIMVSYKKDDGTWTEPIGIAELNTPGHDAAIALSPDGQTLFIFKSTNEDKGDIYMSILEGNKWTEPVRLNSNINTEYWEGSCSVSADGKYLYFASERPGGYGGRDLWVSEKEGDDWGPATNLGPIINTKYDEDAPFIHPDGITLFFSSKGHKSIGGYDIMYSIKKEGQWLTPKNMGIPLNTTEDDRYYVINAKGDRGYLSSNRGGYGGKGKQDIYTSTPGIVGEKPVLAVVTGTVFGNEKPIAADIIITKVAENKEFKLTSNQHTGKYYIALSPGMTYKVKVSAKGFEPTEEIFDIENIKEFTQINKNFFLLTTEQVAKINEEIKKENEQLKQEKPQEYAKTEVTISNDCSSKLPENYLEVKKQLKNIKSEKNYDLLVKLLSNYCLKGLTFRVQIAAYHYPKNYSYKHLIEFGQPIIQAGSDGITRFYLSKECSTFIEAEAWRQKAILKGQTDAWIVGFYNGKRYTLKELLNVNFFATN